MRYLKTWVKAENLLWGLWLRNAVGGCREVLSCSNPSLLLGTSSGNSHAEGTACYAHCCLPTKASAGTAGVQQCILCILPPKKSGCVTCSLHPVLPQQLLNHLHLI